MTLEQATSRVIGALEQAGIAHTSNYYGIPRATQDADVVVQLTASVQRSRVADFLGPAFAIDSQASLETITGNLRHVVRLPATPFVVELFVLGDDPFQLERFRRRVPTRIPSLGDRVFRWGRPKDLEDARDVLAVQGDALDLPYIETWCGRHETLARLHTVLAQLPPV